MLRIAIVIGSTRPVRRTEVVARWVAEACAQHPVARSGKASFDVIDLADQDLPVLDERAAALWGDYRGAHTRRWAATIAAYDGFVFVTPEYNHSFPAALKNAIDYLFAEWHDKAAGFVSHGSSGGVRAVEALRLVLAEVKVATVRSQVALNTFTDFALTAPGDPGVCRPSEMQQQALHDMLDELVAWGAALKPLRESANAA